MSPTPTPRELPAEIRHLGKVHHVALIVRSIDASLGLWRDMLGLELETVMDIPQDRVRIAFLGVGESKVELVEPTDDTTGVARFLESKGEGFHHVCFEVANLAETLIRLELDGLELIDSAPRRGAEGPVAFLHPRSCHGVLVELIEGAGRTGLDRARLQLSRARRAAVSRGADGLGDRPWAHGAHDRDAAGSGACRGPCRVAWARGRGLVRLPRPG